MEEVYDRPFSDGDRSVVRQSRGEHSEESKGIIKTIMDNEATIQQIDMQLKGYTLKINMETGQFQWEKSSEPYVEDDLRALIINVVRSHINPNTQYSNIEWEVIQTICESLQESLATLFFFNLDKVRGNDNMIESDRLARASIIIEMIIHPIWIGLFQPFKGGQRDMVIKTSAYSESYTGKPEEKKKKILPF